MSAPDLIPDAPGAIAVVLGPSGLEQLVSFTEPCTGSGGCGWDLVDASTSRYLIENDLGDFTKQPAGRRVANRTSQD
jgi:hypothetical protein